MTQASRLGVVAKIKVSLLILLAKIKVSHLMLSASCVIRPASQDQYIKQIFEK